MAAHEQTARSDHVGGAGALLPLGGPAWRIRLSTFT